MELCEADIQPELDRRCPGNPRHVTQRNEPDAVEILSGVFEGRTTGTPICLLIRNTDQRSKDYCNLLQTFRPGHADYTFLHKYGVRDPRGGGRASARLTAPMVGAGAVTRVTSRVSRPTWTNCEKRVTVAARIHVAAHNVSVGLGEPLFDRLDAVIAHAMMGINAVKGVEIGAGFACVAQRGTTHGDELSPEGFRSNNAGADGPCAAAPRAVRRCACCNAADHGAVALPVMRGATGMDTSAGSSPLPV